MLAGKMRKQTKGRMITTEKGTTRVPQQSTKQDSYK